MIAILRQTTTALLIMILIAACSTATSNDPDAVFKAFSEHLAKKDLDGAEKYVTKNSKPTLKMMKKGLEMAEKMKDSLRDNPMDEFEKATIHPAKIMGDSAIIALSKKSNNEQFAEFKLIKESDGWKVDFTMPTLMRMGMRNAEQNGAGIPDGKIPSAEEIEKGMQMADSVMKKMSPEMIEEIQKKLEKFK